MKFDYKEIDRIIDIVINSIKIDYPSCINIDDLKQNARLDIYKNNNLFDHKRGSYYSFVYKIAKSAIIKSIYKYRDCRYKGRFNKSLFFSHFDRLENVFVFIKDENIEAFENQYIYEIINKAKKKIANVSNMHLKIFEMRFYDDISLFDVANHFNLNYNKVRGIFSYSWKIFKEESRKNYRLLT